MDLYEEIKTVNKMIGRLWRSKLKN